jgi:hypothetical protein
MGLIRMAYRAGDVKFSRRLLETEQPAQGEVLYVGPARDDLVWDAAKMQFRAPNAQEIAAQEAAEQAKEAERQESETARDDAKRALATLDTIIAGIDGATLAQAKTAIKQLAQIQRHIILATVGR